jgi:hypothetical protein
MPVATIDTHEVVKELTAAGFTVGQAEAVTRIVKQAQSLDLSDLVTKSDLAATRTELQNAITLTGTNFQNSLEATRTELQNTIALTRADLQTSLAETKADILKWMVSAFGVQTVVIIGSIVALMRMIH